jgi:hypothetical protein
MYSPGFAVYITLGLMSTSVDIQPLPEEKKYLRDRLRVAGYELIRYTSSYATRIASRYRHPSSEYDYGIHKITFVRPNGQLVVSKHAHHSSESWLENWVNHFVDKEKPAGLKLVPRWFKENWLLTAIVPPYSLALMGLAAAGDAAARREQKEREALLGSFRETPIFEGEDEA